MKVQKREKNGINGVLVDFKKSSIVNAVEGAMRETLDGVDSKLSNEIANKIEKMFGEKDILKVEEIQDTVEMLLMKSPRPDVAKRYIIYRENKLKHKPIKQEQGLLLTDEFISKYKHLPNPMGQLGQFVYYRTYSRYLPEEKRRVYWWETVRRAVEYNCNLVRATREEAEELYDNIFNLRQFCSGRSFWVANTQAAKDYPMSNYNCFRRDTEFLTRNGIKTFKDFEDGDFVEVLNGNGAWSDSQIKNFEKQEIVKMTVRRFGTKYTEDIYTTTNHVWFVDKHNEKRYEKVETKSLQKGDILRKKYRYEHQTLNTCNIGIQHGIVFGDGTFDKTEGHCKVSLIGKKQDLSKYFTTGAICSEGERDTLLIYGLPYNWKELPLSTANPEYIKGFIKGLLLTDGRIDSSARVSQSSFDDVKNIQSLCEIIGLTTSQLKEVTRTNSNFGEYGNMYEFNIHKESLKRHGLIEDEVKTINWVVESIKYTGTYEDVWCVIEPVTHSFTLRGGIHTHNCAFQVIDNFEAFEDLFYLLMIGSGVGLRVLKDDVVKLPKIRTNYEIYHKEYSHKTEKEDNTCLTFTNNNIAKITIGDSKEGWIQGLRYLFNLLTKHEFKKIETIVINYDYVRPKGEKLKKFGGTASGHESLKTMFSKIDYVLKKAKERDGLDSLKLRPIDCLDISNIIAENVVSGGVRRSSEIVLIDADDTECIDAKTNLYKETNGNWSIDKTIAHRQMSNNSIFYTEKPTREKLHWQMTKMRYSGEPAWINGVGMNSRVPSGRKGTNPCGEILLDDKGMCNLTTINVLAFVENGKLNEEKLLRAQYLSARIGYRMTCVEMELPKWNEILQRDKLIGCSLTGWQDMVNATNMTKEEQIELLKKLREAAHDSANAYAKEIGQNKPLLNTTVKPEGTISQLPTVSSGVHYSHSPYFVRRVRISSSDPLVKVCEELEYPVFPEVGQDLETCKTKVIEFPVKAPEGKTKYDISAIEQLENYKMFMTHYVDHNCSITVHVRNNEWDEVEQWIWDNWEHQIGITFLSLDDSFYQLLPYEAITEEEYNERLSKMKPFIPSLISKYEVEEEELDLDGGDCATGACPIR